MEGMLRGQEKLLILDMMPLFADLALADKRFIAAASSIVEYKKGEMVYEEGAPPDALYCVVNGRLKAFVARRGTIEILEYLKRGRYFGIISLLTDEPHSMAVQAVNDSIILKIPRDSFADILKRVPQLAVHFSQTLSRRLKKGAGEKRLFESTIISVLGAAANIGTSNYALNLAASLKVQTGKKVILVNIGSVGEDLAAFLGPSTALKTVVLDTPFFDEALIRTNIFRHASGLDLVSISHEREERSQIIPLLSFLTADYHYVVVDLPVHIDKAIFESLRQADTLHIVTAADRPSLDMTGRLIAELEKSAPGISPRIKVITSEYGIMKLVDFANRKDILKHGVYATLPDLTRSGSPKPDDVGSVLVISHPECEYTKAVRRISRDVGGCLIGLALGSGAAVGLAHTGVLKVIEEEKIPIDVVAGTSMGALIGALWASGRDALTIAKILTQFKRKIDALRLVDLTIPKKGLIKGRGVRRFLREQFGNRTFHDLKFPLKIVTCDIEKREEVVLDRGSLADAVMASVSIPGIFEPVVIEGMLLVDGGIINPLPTNVLMKLGVAKIIAVNALPSPQDIQRSKKKVTNIFDIIVNSVQASEYLLAEMSCQDVDIAMHPVLPRIDWYEFYESQKVIKRGEEEALRYLKQLRDLAAAS